MQFKVTELVKDVRLFDYPWLPELISIKEDGLERTVTLKHDPRFKLKIYNDRHPHDFGLDVIRVIRKHQIGSQIPETTSYIPCYNGVRAWFQKDCISQERTFNSMIGPVDLQKMQLFSK